LADVPPPASSLRGIFLDSFGSAWVAEFETLRELVELLRGD
jgi:hypothetical protein